VASRTISEIEDDLDAVRARLRSILLGNVPLEGAVGRTRIKLTDNVKELRRYQADLEDELRKAQRRAGRRGPARREVY
jgi:hypothetical protein